MLELAIQDLVIRDVAAVVFVNRMRETRWLNLCKEKTTDEINCI